MHYLSPTYQYTSYLLQWRCGFFFNIESEFPKFVRNMSEVSKDPSNTVKIRNFRNTSEINHKSIIFFNYPSNYTLPSFYLCKQSIYFLISLPQIPVPHIHPPPHCIQLTPKLTLNTNWKWPTSMGASIFTIPLSFQYFIPFP